MADQEWPTGADLQSRLTGSGLWGRLTAAQQAALDTERAVIAAKEEFEARTGYRPFLAAALEDPEDVTSADETRYFDRPDGGPYLDLQGGLVQAPTTVAVDEAPFVLNTSVWLYPLNALAQGKPYTHLRFGYRTAYDWQELDLYASRLYSGIRQIAVTGRWGYAAELPTDVFEAVLERAQGYLGEQTGFAVFGGVSEWARGDVRKKYDAKATGTAGLNVGAASKFERAVKRYSRLKGVRSVPVMAG